MRTISQLDYILRLWGKLRNADDLTDDLTTRIHMQVLTASIYRQKCLWLTYSLSKCLKYPGFIFLCPQKLSKKNQRKKPKSLNYPNTILEFFSEFGYVQDFFYVPRTIQEKKPNTLNYPNSIRYFGDLAKFSRILHENEIFYNLCFFCKNLAMFNSVLLSKQLPNVR